MSAKAIAFLQLRPFPLANQVVFERLQAAYPGYRFDLFDIATLVRSRRQLVAGNLWPVLRHYGGDIALGRKSRHRAFWRTPYMFRAVGDLLHELIDPAAYTFSFQMQSLFDGHITGLPHFVYTDHTHLENQRYSFVNRQSLFPSLWTDCERQIYHNATGVFVRSQNIERSLLHDYQLPADKVECVYAGANVAAGDRPVDFKPRPTANILFIGLDWERKGGPDLAAAFARVVAEMPQASLTIVGSEPILDLPNTKILGPLNPADLEPHFRRAQLFCMPSLVEPFGIVYVEAMARALPVVATRIGAVTDMVQSGVNGLLVEPGDVAGLAAALLQLLKSPEQAAVYGRAGWEMAHKRYNWDNVVAKITRTINQAIDVKT